MGSVKQIFTKPLFTNYFAPNFCIQRNLLIFAAGKYSLCDCEDSFIVKKALSKGIQLV